MTKRELRVADYLSHMQQAHRANSALHAKYG